MDEMDVPLLHLPFFLHLFSVSLSRSLAFVSNLDSALFFLSSFEPSAREREGTSVASVAP